MTDSKLSKEDSSNSDQRPPEHWSPEDFANCRQRALSGQPSGTKKREEWLRARMDLVWAYQYGYGTEPDSRRYFELLRQVAELEQGSEIGAKHHLAFAFRDGIGTPVDDVSYVDWMRLAAEDGDREAMFKMAEAYQSGIGVEPDESMYFHWLSKMAENESPLALMRLAEAFKTGTGTKLSAEHFFENAQKAVEQAQLAVEKESTDQDLASEDLPRAMHLVAEASRDGFGVGRSTNRYFQQLQQSVQAANDAIAKIDPSEPEQLKELRQTLAPIKRQLAIAYWKGQGTEKDENKAFELMRTAANEGDSVATLTLAEFYTEGIGRSVNRRQAFECYKRAAEAGNADGMYKTAVAYGTRTGTKANATEFQRLARRALRAGQERAYMVTGLADLHRDGLINATQVATLLKIFEELRDVVQQIKVRQKLEKADAADGVAHFTTLEALYSMLPTARPGTIEAVRERKNSLRLYNVEYVNDPQEGRGLIEGHGNGREAIRELFPILAPSPHEDTGSPSYDSLPLWGLDFSVYVGSFTLLSDRLDLWRAYGNNGEGFCIVTPVSAFTELNGTTQHGFAGLAAVMGEHREVPMTLYNVSYGDAEVTEVLAEIGPHLERLHEVRSKLEGLRRNGHVIKEKVNHTARAILSDILYLYKNAEYDSEREVRMLAPFPISAVQVLADEKVPGKLYVKTRPFLFVPGSKIIIGPRVASREAVRLELRHRLDRNEHTGVSVEYSTIPYR